MSVSSSDAQIPGELHLAEDYTGWRLTEARVALQQSGWRDEQISQFEIAPPPLFKAREKQQPVFFGDWRVLRCALVRDAAARPDESTCKIELMVAREQIAAPSMISDSLISDSLISDSLISNAHS